MSNTDEFGDHDDPVEADGRRYADRSELKPLQLASPLQRLELLGGDFFMRVQASHLDIVDQFLLDLESTVLRRLIEDERTPPEAHFLAAQSAMWIFAAYELLRTWRERAQDFIKLADNGGFPNKLASLRSVDVGYEHPGRKMRIRQLQEAMDDPKFIERLRNQVRHLYMPFTMLEYLRVAIAKHEVSGKSKGIALFPGYGRINTLCGSLDYELENGKYSLGTLSRRNVADSIRLLDVSTSPPSNEAVESFNQWVSGKGVELPPFD